jgi:hypothetical protein
MRLSASSISVMLMALRVFYNVAVGKAAYDNTTGLGNPCISYLPIKFMHDVTKEQLAAEVVVKQARPTFMFQLKAVISMMDMALKYGRLPAQEAWNIRVHQCIFLGVFFVTGRSFDLTRCKGLNILVVKEHVNWVLNHTIGKTVRDMPRVASLICHSDPDLDPVSHFERLLEMATALGIKQLCDTLLFRIYDKTGNLSASSISTRAVNDAVRKYWQLAGIYDGHTIHGVRTGSAIELALRGAPVHEVAEHVGWSEETCRHYLRLIDVLRLCGTSSSFEKDFMGGVTAQSFDAFSRLLQARSSLP